MNAMERLRLTAPNVAALARELNIDGRVADAVEHNAIRAEARGLENHQRTIVQHCEDGLSTTRLEALRLLDAERADRAERAAYSPLQRLDEARRMAEWNIQQAIFNRRRDLEESFKTITELKSTLWSIRSRRNYKRDPRPPGNKGLAGAILFAALVMETLMNGVLFASGSERGLLGGVTQALFISIINLLLSFGLGYLLKRKNTKQGVEKGVYSGALLVSHQAAAWLTNLAAAHYRSAVAVLENYQAANKQFLVRMLTHPFQIETFESFILLILGMVIAYVVLYKGDPATKLWIPS
ncbi:hypothetical protein [Desulfovibrio psychrotolerans]|uniref:Uncharacterized protein n=1 Tax=Desulfovibrio psychrotolerans TaxID=415242 RepID=A0A7J0BVC9_9BACT|nr:hypothetical protein [Desulfovibrio psychrotolerans]GFM37667.1 hypothetical protein DSM19430T_23510 [Desulfovibrio psychrotolerans]